MKIIKTENIPRLLYKYRKFDQYTKYMLSKGEIYFSTTDELNDPFERFFMYNEGDYCCNHKNEVIYLDQEKRTKDMRNKIMKDEFYGIFSFCETRNNIPMYIHYADGFKGICVGFDWEQFGLEFVGSLPLQKNVPQKVRYPEAPPIIEGRPDEWLNVFLSKSVDFSWEQEWRMFYCKGKKVITRQAIREIIFGFRFFEKNKENKPCVEIEEVKKWIENLEGVKLYIAKPIVGKYELDVSPKTPDEIFSLLCN